MADKTLEKQIREKVASDPAWVERAIVVIYQRQTADEQSARTTVHENKMGFAGPDAGILSDFARRILDGRHLSEKQLAVAYKLMPKYAKQLAAAAEAKKASKE